MKPQVVVVGSFVQDLCFQCERFPRAGETLAGTSFTGPGGKGSNQAVAAARAGAPTLFVGAIGDDALGRDAQAFYQAEGIPAKWAIKADHPTGSAAILVDRKGQNEIIVAVGANLQLHPDDLPADALSEAKVLLTQLESNHATTAAALHIAQTGGALTILNPAPLSSDFTAELLTHVDILAPNESEFVTLLQLLEPEDFEDLTPAALGKLSMEALHHLCGRLGVPMVLLTLGQRGCLISRADGYLALPAFTVEAVDTTGAGDAFLGGFAAGLLRHEGDLAAAARHGCAVAALAVTRLGTAPAMPTQEAVEAFLATQNTADS